MFNRCFSFVVVVSVSVWAGSGVSLGAGAFHGHALLERVSGDPSKGYVELYEYKAFLAPLGFGTGYSYHIGDLGTAVHPGKGCITFRNVPAGTYTLMTSWGEIFPRGRIVSGIIIGNSTTEQNAIQPTDYSGYYDKGQWDPTGGNPVFQTFVATGTAINRVSFQKADPHSDGDIRFAILRDNGGAVQNWTQVGPTRSTRRGAAGGDHWVAWEAGEVPTVPGGRYAVRLSATSGANIQPYWCSDSYYPQGTGYRGGESNPSGHDYYIAVFSDSAETLATILPQSGDIPLTDWWEKWAQSYTAQGSSFAGCTLMGSVGGSGGWDFPVKVSIHKNGPDGPQVGPTKTMPGAFRPFIGVLGACFGPDEVPTSVGTRYWIVYEHAKGTGFNACRMEEGDVYGGGTGYYLDAGGNWRSLSYDLLMSVFEYPSSAATPTPTPSPGDNLLENPGFEESFEQSHPGWLNPGGYWADNTFPKPSQPHEGAHWAGFSSGNGGTLVSDMYQVVDVEAGRRYRLSTWAHAGGTNGTAIARLYWVDGELAGSADPGLVDTMVWMHPEEFKGWERLTGNVTPTSDSITFLLETEIQGWGGGVNWDDCFLGEVVNESGFSPTWLSLFEFASDWQETAFTGSIDLTGDGSVMVDDLLELAGIWHETEYGQ